MSESMLVRLGDLITIKHGFAFKGEFFRDDPCVDILLTPGNFAIGGGFKADKLKFYAGEVADEYVLSPGDLLVSMTDLSKDGDTLGFPAMVPNWPGRRFLHNQRLGRILLKNPSCVDAMFIYYILCSNEYRHEVLASATGSTVRHTSPSKIGAFSFALPPIAVQQRIANILSSLDKKIELNRRTNETLEVMASALFKSWFIDFEPVRAKMADRNMPGMNPGLLRAFPSTLVESAIGLVPAQWRLSRVGDHVSLQRGTTYKSNLLGLPGPYLLGLGSIRRNGGFRGDKLTTYGGESPEKLLLRPGDLYVSLKDVTQAGDLLGAVARVPPNVPLGRLTQDTVKLDLTTTEVSGSYLYGLLSHGDYRAYCRARAIGTTNLSLTREDFLNYPILVPSHEILSKFCETEQALRGRLDVNTSESALLTGLRDLLLPKLLSGELGVRDAERVVGKVA